MADPKDTEVTGTGTAYEATVKVEQTETRPADEPTTETTETTETTKTVVTEEDE